MAISTNSFCDYEQENSPLALAGGIRETEGLRHCLSLSCQQLSRGFLEERY